MKRQLVINVMESGGRTKAKAVSIPDGPECVSDDAADAVTSFMCELVARNDMYGEYVDFTVPFILNLNGRRIEFDILDCGDPASISDLNAYASRLVEEANKEEAEETL